MKKGSYSYIVHDLYGCESGCCGHTIYLCSENGDIIDSVFEFSHPYGEDYNTYAESMCKGQYNVPVKLELCEISDD